MDKDVRIGLLQDALRSVARQCESLGRRVGSAQAPGGVDYISKHDASEFALAIAAEARAAADGEGRKRDALAEPFSDAERDWNRHEK